MTLAWQPPSDPDFAYVALTRFPATTGATIVYHGRGTAFTDRTVMNGVTYRYVLTAYDAAGNASAGVSVSARPRSLLLAPRDGARLRHPPILRWVATSGAAYYNVQLWRDGRKIQSAWPRRPRIAVRSSWRYRGRLYTLRPGTYRWYVWPGFGSPAAAQYGNLLGFGRFAIVRR